MRNLLFLSIMFVLVVATIVVLTPRRRKTRTSLCVLFFINNHFKPLKFMKLNKHQFVDALLGLVDEQGNKIEATFSDVKLTSSDESIITISDVDADGILDIVPVAAGNAQINVSAVVSYTDPKNGEPVVAGKDADPVDFTVTEDAAKTKLVVDFTNPTAFPALAKATTAADSEAGTVTSDITKGEEQTGSQQQIYRMAVSQPKILIPAPIIRTRNNSSNSIAAYNKIKALV